MNENILFIVARYNEDIEWAENLPGDIVIYNKGEDFPFPYPRIDLPNVGRACETFVRGIVENYEALDLYSHFVFLQGHPFDHCPNLFDLIEEKKNATDFYGLTKSHTVHTIPGNQSHFEAFNKSFLVFEKLINVDKTIVSYEIFNHKTKTTINSPNELEELICVLDFLGIPYLGKEISWSTGAQYIVPVEFIKNKSLEWWKDLSKFIHHCYLYLEWPTLGYVMERIWPLIWEFETK